MTKFEYIYLRHIFHIILNIQNIPHLCTIEETAYYSAPSEANEKLRQTPLMREFRNEAQLNVVLIIPQ